MISSTKPNFDIDHELKRALDFHRSGQLECAAEVYNRILEARPNHADALHLLGILLHSKGARQKGKILVNQAIVNDPTAPLFYVSLGDMLRAEKNYTAAILNYRQALVLNPDLVTALCNMGNALREQGAVQQALASYQKCLVLDSRLPEVHNNMGLTYHQNNQYESAQSCFKKAIKLNPCYAEAYNNLGNVYRDQSHFDKAIAEYQKALHLMPDNSSIHYNIGLAFQMSGQPNRAKDFFQKTIEIDPQCADGYHNLGKLLHDQNLLAPAVEMYDRAIEIDPEHVDAHFNRAISLLTGARFEEGWSEFEWRFKRAAWRSIYPHRLMRPRWDGMRFDGQRLLVHCEQGFGDTIQFIRYLPQVKKMGGTVVFQAQRELCELLQGLAGIDELLPMSFDHAPLTDYDQQIPLMSLPGLFGTTLETIPETVPYIDATEEERKYWHDRISGLELSIGLTWAAKKTYTHEKSCAPDHFSPLTKLPGIRIFGLQKSSSADSVQNIPPEIINLGEEFENFADTAAAIDCLDLVISVDTAVAHLAGAMGKPVWVLLPFSADWRWLLERRNSPWYPTMRLFRQPSPRDWGNVVEQVKTELSHWIKSQNQYRWHNTALGDH